MLGHGVMLRPSSIALPLLALSLAACARTTDDDPRATGGAAGSSEEPGTGGSAQNGGSDVANGATSGAPTAGGTGGRLTGGTGGRLAGGTGGRLAGGTGGRLAGGTGGEAGGDTAGTAGGPSGGAGGESGAPIGGQLEGLAFDIEIPVSGDYPWCVGACEPATALVTRAGADELEIVWGSTGHAEQVVLTRAESGWELDGTLVLGTEHRSHTMCTTTSTLGPATFDFADHDGDERIDLAITGSQETVQCSDDTSSTRNTDEVLTGRLDARPPVASLSTSPTEPVHGLSITLDKPLEPDATCTLVAEDTGEPIELSPRQMAGYVVGFDTDLVLPLGARYATAIEGADFAGVGSPAGIPVAIIEDFGVLAPDGFESGSAEGVLGGELVGSFGVPAIDGQTMLYAAPGETVLLHLQRSGSEESLVFDARMVDGCGSVFSMTTGPALEVAVVGSDTIERATLGMGSGEPTSVTDDFWTSLVGEVEHLEVPLPGPGVDVLVYLRGDSYAGAGCSRAGALLDSVHLE